MPMDGLFVSSIVLMMMYSPLLQVSFNTYKSNIYVMLYKSFISLEVISFYLSDRHAAFCYLIHNYASRIRKAFIAYWFESISFSFET